MNVLTSPQWTTGILVAQLHADPSGVQAASTEFQAALLSGMSTITTRARYISLFTMARYYRMEAGENVEAKLALKEHLRRLEALIGVCTVRHHIMDSTPIGIIGNGSARELASHDEFPLSLSVQQPAYRIYRGALGSLGLFDLGEDSDPLFEAAKPLAASWDISAAGPLGDWIRSGVLPPRISRDVVDRHCAAFCLCRVPHDSAECEQLIKSFLALDRVPRDLTEQQRDTTRSTSWRLLLELVRLTPAPTRLGGESTLARLMSPDLGHLDRSGVMEHSGSLLRKGLLHWRWVAARTLFERGWTYAFTRAFHEVSQQHVGITPNELRARMRLDLKAAPHFPELTDDVERVFEDPTWLVEHFSLGTSVDGLSLIVAGLQHAKGDIDRHSDDEQLQTLWSSGDIPFSKVFARFQSAISNREKTDDMWAEIAEEALAEHVRISLRKMRAGNPDSLLVDYDEGHWFVPAKAQAVQPRDAEASTRLDIALRWAQELGLVKPVDTDVYMLTPSGEDWCERWDKVYSK